jgi:hypothetical protein
MLFSTATVPFSAQEPIATSTEVYAYGPGRSTESFVARALGFFIDNELIVPEASHLELIVHFALRAQEFFFASALFPPEQTQLDHFFDEFVQLCAIRTPGHASACAPSGIDAVAPQV